MDISDPLYKGCSKLTSAVLNCPENNSQAATHVPVRPIKVI